MIRQPKAKLKAKQLTQHNDTRTDNYFWLNEKENPEVIDYLNAENAYRTAKMADTEVFQKDLFNEIVGRIAQTDMSVPYFYKNYWYITRFSEGKEYPIHSRKKENLEAEEDILLDVNVLSQGHSYYAVGGRNLAPNNKFLVYGEDTVSRRLYTLRFKNLETNALFPDSIPNTTGSAVWSSDNTHVFYTQKDPSTLRAYKIMRHEIGTDVSYDVCVYEETDVTFNCGVGKTRSEKYLVIGSSATLSSEYHILESNNPTGDWRLFTAREQKHEYSINHAHDTFYILTNSEAENFRLMTCKEDNTKRESWQEKIPHRPNVLLEGLTLFKNYFVLDERCEGLTRINVVENSGESHLIAFKENVFMAYTSNNAEFDTNILRLGYTSLTTPNSVFDYDTTTRTLHLQKQEAVLESSFKPDDYFTERVYATSNDGAQIPVSLVYKKDLFKQGNNPLLLYGYGSYGHSIDPYFSSARLSLLNRGFVFAIAHIRGGQEMGRKWYESGKFLTKKNTFTDFIACGEMLIGKKYAHPKKLCAMGGSAGGLLMGAIMNLRPELWCSVVAAVPFVDVVTTMLDETIPLTTGEFDEWGNPKDATYYHYMKSYSPYDNVTTQNYPATLITTGLHDSQVQYFEPAKWIANLRALRTNKRTPLYMFCNMQTGHGGASGRFERFKETAMEYAFLLHSVGVKK